MTYQIRDTFILNGKTYFIEQIKTTGRSWFNPYHYGFRPYHNCTACWRGYQCCYAMSEGKLLLINLNINNQNDDYPIFMEVTANTKSPYWHFNASYNNVFFNFKFTGKILIAKDFLYKKYSRYDEYPNIWQYEKVVELHFRRGKIIKVTDMSYEMEYKRQKIELWYDLSKDRRCQQIFQLCCQWIEENKNNFQYGTTDETLKETIKADIARVKLLNNLEVDLPGLKINWKIKRIQNNFIDDNLYKKIVRLCEKWIFDNTDKCTRNSKGRKNSKQRQLSYLKLHLVTSSSPWTKNICSLLKETYPYPPHEIYMKIRGY